MPVIELLRWQWIGYSRYHQSRANLLLHVAVVPLFLTGNVFLLVALTRGWWVGAAISLAATVLSVALQGRGRLELFTCQPRTEPRVDDWRMRCTVCVCIQAYRHHKGRGLTIHSSRTRFAGRLNSGVRRHRRPNEAHRTAYTHRSCWMRNNG